MNVNTVIITGRITKDVELKTSQSGKSYASINVAVNGYNDRVDFIPVTVFGKTAEFLSKNAEKGNMVLVEGSISQNRWTDKNGGNHSDLSVTARNVQLLTWTKKEADNAEDIDIEEPSDKIPF
jgi:single-strand DNA-binding protein